jgi:chromosome segregation ATPase
MKKEEDLHLPFSEIATWLDERSHQNFEDLERTIKDIYDQIGAVFEKIDGDLILLRSASYDENSHPRLVKAGMASRDVVERQMKMLIERIARPTTTDISSSINYHKSIVQNLEKTMQTLQRPLRYVGMLFPEASEQLVSDLSELGSLVGQLGGAIDERHGELVAFKAAEELLSEIQDGRSLQKEIRTQTLEDEKKLEEDKNAAKELEHVLSELRLGAEEQKIASLKEAVEDELKEIRQIEAEIADQISPLTKALGRLSKLDLSDRLTLSPERRRILDLFLRSSHEALEHDISGLMMELRSHVEKDRLGLKERKKEKILKQIDHLLETNSLGKLKARHSKSAEALEDLKRRLAESGSGVHDTEENLRCAYDRISMLEEKIEQNKRDLAVLEEELARDESDLQSRLKEIAGTEVEII